MAYCQRCNRYFRTNHDLWKHENASSAHWICDPCDEDFYTWADRRDHQLQYHGDRYCSNCDTLFTNEDDLEDHLVQSHSYCRDCKRRFKNDYGLQEHYRQSPRHMHAYCVSCKILFQNENNLRAHMNSSTHQPKTVKCPFCPSSFVSRSAQVLHLENGGCSSGITRTEVNQYIRSVDRTNVITNPARMITGSTSDTSTRYFATEAAWNGAVGAYECYFCHCTFNTLTRLNQHLASPRHADKLYRCPLNVCNANFTTLSGLCQHVESEKCGVLKFREVKTVMDGFMSGMKRITC